MERGSDVKFSFSQIQVVEYLLENETMEGDEFNYYFEHGTFMPPKPLPAAHDDTIERPARHISMTIEPPPEDETQSEAETAETPESAPEDDQSETPPDDDKKE